MVAFHTGYEASRQDCGYPTIFGLDDGSVKQLNASWLGVDGSQIIMEAYGASADFQVLATSYGHASWPTVGARAGAGAASSTRVEAPTRRSTRRPASR